MQIESIGIGLYYQLTPIRCESPFWLEILQSGPRTSPKTPKEIGGRSELLSHRTKSKSK
jgi:hypothetical protein